ncbi:MAG: hypothetical protein ABIJ23_03480 [Candidatus Magasanikbacteria bacterium]
MNRKSTEGGKESLGGATNRENLSMQTTTIELVERYGKELFSENLRERLHCDWDNKTMDYNRINFMEVFTMFGADVKQSVAHWRISKIMEGISICCGQLKITDSLGPTNIPEKIYKAIQDGNVDKKSWPIVLEKDGEKIKETASLADFAHFVDTIKANRELGMHRFDMNTLAYNYFTGGDLSRELTTDNGEEKIIDINDLEVNPRDDYKDLDINGYLDHIKKSDVQAGLQLMTEWRYQSEGHREIAGQAMLVQVGKLPSDSLFIPLSGRMAADITLSDLQKQDKSGMNGQPQEVAEIDEEKTGAFIRFNLKDLAQRRRGGDIRQIQKTTRMAKAMCGLTLSEEAYSQIETITDEKDEKKSKQMIYLCGHDLDGAIITGMKTRYDKPMKKLRGFGLSSDEASDMVMTDVVIPCILNNPNDWLTALSSTYGVGGSKGAQSLLQNREVFQGFELNIMCRNLEKDGYPIEWKSFKGFNELWSYVTGRISKGHIDQPDVDGFVARGAKDISEGVKSENEFFLNKIDDLQGKNIHNLCQIIFGEETSDYLSEYIKKGTNASFDKMPGIDAEDDNHPAELDVKYDFDGIVGMRLEEGLRTEDGQLEAAIEKLYEIDINTDTDIPYVIAGLLETLKSISPADRKKIHS